MNKKEKLVPTVSDLKKLLKGTELKTKDIKHNYTGIHYDKVLYYVTDAKFGISAWATKERKVHRIKTEKQMEAFVSKLNTYVKKHKNKE